MRNPEFWEFVRKHEAEGREPGLTQQVFADYLDEHLDPRAVIARGHRMPDINRGFGRGVYELPDSAGTVRPHDVHVYSTAPRTLAHGGSGVRLGEAYAWGDPERGIPTSNHPVLHWQMKDPRTKKNAVFMAPATPDQLHDFIDKLPKANQFTWRVQAHHRGWYRSTPTTGPTKLGRKTPETQSDFGQALATLNSANHQKRRQIALSILREAGLTPATVKAVLAHEGPGRVRASVLQIIKHHADPAVSKFVAAWYGLLSGERNLTVFHPGEGEDYLHVITSPLPAEHVSTYLGRSGVPSYSVEPRAAGSRAYVFNPQGKLDLESVAGGLNASNSRIRGSGQRLGSGANADASSARAAYRTVIGDFERTAGTTPAA